MKQYDDIRNLTADQLRSDGIAVDVICGGFPCQDISLAGKGAGLSGARSGLWYEFHRVIDKVRPTWAVIENVSALRARGLDAVLGSLASIGYDAEWHCIPAAAVGAPHRRDRVWIVAHAARLQPGWTVERAERKRIGSGGQSELVANPVGVAGRTRRLGDTDEGTGRRDADRGGVCADGMADTQQQRLEGRPTLAGYLADQLAAIERSGQGAHVGSPTCELPHRGGTSTGKAGRREPSDAGWWLVEPDVGRVAHGVPARVDRLRALGNAVVPQIPQIIGQAIMNDLRTRGE